MIPLNGRPLMMAGGIAQQDVLSWRKMLVEVILNAIFYVK